jgi:CheY-like chemotaxis protein
MTKARRVLIIDDDKDFCQTLSEILHSAGYECVMAHDGISGVTTARAENPDAIVLDIKMPAGDGLSVYNRLKLSSKTRNIPLVFISGYYQGDIKGELFIRKPFDPDELISYLKEVLRERLSMINRENPAV